MWRSTVHRHIHREIWPGQYIYSDPCSLLRRPRAAIIWLYFEIGNIIVRYMGIDLLGTVIYRKANV